MCEYTLIKYTSVKFGKRDLGLPPQAKFCKNHLRRIPLLGKFIPKITNFGDFGGCGVSPHFKSDNGEKIWRKGRSHRPASSCRILPLSL